MPLAATVGPARVIAIADTESVKPSELEQHLIQAGERILLKTANSDHAWNTDDFIENFVYISRQGGRYLAACNVAAVGVDYLSVGGFTKDGPETHEALLSAGVWVIEGLNLSGIEPGDYE
nr:cyclase family protein [Acidobacteriota bacterium]